MFKIIGKENLNNDVVSLTVEARLIADKALAGQFVTIVVDEKGERIPLTLADWDKAAGTVTLIFQKVGFTTNKLSNLKVGDNIEHILGPLGHPRQNLSSSVLLMRALFLMSSFSWRLFSLDPFGSFQPTVLFLDSSFSTI